ncbi:hypothetical protein [Psychrobacter okhotskensis]|uniref:hypothetical protein n=1 Tax=Psychrobacter okhotskensis TaxID=212403 RepID=UPI001566AFF6|nr:hypothetical protein [Psychrobacter okhotskensis]NRD70998.1 hypothetical protein [Psychrobacter okhotskensis]
MRDIIFRGLAILVGLPMMLLGAVSLFDPEGFELMYSIGSLAIGIILSWYGVVGTVLLIGDSFSGYNDSHTISTHNQVFFEKLLIFLLITIFTIRVIIDIIDGRASWLEVIYLSTTVFIVIAIGMAKIMQIESLAKATLGYWLVLILNFIFTIIILITAFYNIGINIFGS